MRRGFVRLRPLMAAFSRTRRDVFFPAPGTARHKPKMRSRVERSAHAPRDGVSRGERERRASAVPIPASRAEFGVARSVCRVHPRRTLEARDVSDRRGNRICADLPALFSARRAHRAPRA